MLFQLMGQAVMSGDLSYFYDNLDLPQFGSHMTCRDVDELRRLLDDDSANEFLSALFPSGEYPSCDFSESYQDWLHSRYDEDTINVSLHAMSSVFKRIQYMLISCK